MINAIAQPRRRQRPPSLPLPRGFHLEPSKQVLITHTPTVPSVPLQSPDLRIMRAWIDAELDGRNVIAAIETAISQAQEVSSRRRLGWYWTRMSPGVRALIAESHGEGLKRLLGYWAKEGAFQDGLAGLSERESRIYWLTLRGWRGREIQRDLQPVNVRDDPSLWRLSLKTIYNDRWSAKVKLLRIFGLRVPERSEDDLDEI